MARLQHIANVVRIDTTDATAGYIGSDVMYIDDHGFFTCENCEFPCSGCGNPAVPPGSAGASADGCTPFLFGYTFDEWKGPMDDSQNYMFAVPTRQDKNYAYSISGVLGEWNFV